MIDCPAKMNVLCTSISHALERLGCVAHSPLDLRDLIRQFFRAGGRCEELLRLFSEADRPAISSRKFARWASASTVVSLIPIRVEEGRR